MINFKDTIGNRTRDHPACSAVPQLTTPPCAPLMTRSEVLLPGAPSPLSKRPICEDDHCPVPSADVKNEWKYNFTPRYMFSA